MLPTALVGESDLVNLTPDCVVKVGIGDPEAGKYVLMVLEFKAYRDDQAP